MLFQPISQEYGQIYTDSSSGDKWEEYEFEYEEHTNPAIGLRKYPYPSIEAIIAIALTSPHMDEVSGAAALLWELDRKGMEVRTHLLQELASQLDEISIERFDRIYWRTELYDITNNRTILNKSFQEIEQDADYYRVTASKANELREKIIKE